MGKEQERKYRRPCRDNTVQKGFHVPIGYSEEINARAKKEGLKVEEFIISCIDDRLKKSFKK